LISTCQPKTVYSSFNFPASLCLSLNNILKNDLNNLLQKFPGAQEPDFVATLAISSVPKIAKQLNNSLKQKSIKLKLHTIFCHLSPQIQFKGTSCELGDILIVHIHKRLNGSQFGRALLLQAKMASKNKPISKIPPSQEQLYSTWPRFKYYRSGFLTGQERKVFENNSTNDRQFLLIDKTNKTLLCSRLPLNGSSYKPTDFAATIIDVLQGCCGRNFDSCKKHGIGWSRVVWDLIEIGKLKLFNRNNINQRSVPRFNLVAQAQKNIAPFFSGYAEYRSINCLNKTQSSNENGFFVFLFETSQFPPQLSQDKVPPVCSDLHSAL